MKYKAHETIFPDNVSIMHDDFIFVLEKMPENERRDFAINGLYDFADELPKYRGEPAKITKVFNELKKKYNERNIIWSALPSHNTAGKYLDEYREQFLPYDFEQVKKDNPQLYTYMRQIELLNNSAITPSAEDRNNVNIDKKKEVITNQFAKHLEMCLYRFNDPLGEKVDLLAQWSVAREYYIRDKVKKTYTKDLDAILDYTPWITYIHDPDYVGSLINPRDAYEWALFEDNTLAPKMTHAIAYTDAYSTPKEYRDEDGEIVAKYGIDLGEIQQGKKAYIPFIYAHLGLPFYLIFRDYKAKAYAGVMHMTEKEYQHLNIRSPKTMRKIFIGRGLIAKTFAKNYHISAYPPIHKSDLPEEDTN